MYFLHNTPHRCEKRVKTLGQLTSTITYANHSCKRSLHLRSPHPQVSGYDENLDLSSSPSLEKSSKLFITKIVRPEGRSLESAEFRVKSSI